jgi:hypothetical protein
MTRQPNDFGIATALPPIAAEWAMRERANPTSPCGGVLRHLEGGGCGLRGPQKEAVHVYLWLKFEGKNQRLADLAIAGCFGHAGGSGTPAQKFLRHFAQKNNLSDLDSAIAKNIADGKDGEEGDAVRRLLHDCPYPNYFYSLPMGAGKTYLMAAFICLDLYFSERYPGDGRFAQNFLVVAPQAGKTAILPALGTIREFDSRWVIPDDARANEIGNRLISAVILDEAANPKHSNRVINPNVKLVRDASQNTGGWGAIFVTNAEKIAPDRVYESAVPLIDRADKPGEIKQKLGNELREILAGVENLGVMLDEGVHAYNPAEKDAKKLRRCVELMSKRGNVRFCLGFSGTPYMKTTHHIAGQKIAVERLQDVVYDYPLGAGIGKFLKRPQVVKHAAQDESRFVHAALDLFFREFGELEYPRGRKSKIAFYCRHIEAINESVLPAVQKWYQKNRPGRFAQETLRYHISPGKDGKKYPLPPDARASFLGLDEPHSPHRVVLLVAIGKEGWNCKSLTAVALPRGDSPPNFVLQTSCRCLREVDDAGKERALIILSPENYQTLETELRESHRMTIGELAGGESPRLPILPRKPQLGRLLFNQVRRTVIVTESGGDAVRPPQFNFAAFKRRNPLDSLGDTRYAITEDGSLKQMGRKELKADGGAAATRTLKSQWRFIVELSRRFYGAVSAAELFEKHGEALDGIRRQLAKESEWFQKHSNPSVAADALAEIAASMAVAKDYKTEFVPESAEIELLEWHVEKPTAMASRTMTPEIDPKDAPEVIAAKTKIADPNDLSFSYAPYIFDSGLEGDFLAKALGSELPPNVELYYNGMRRENELTSFHIDIPGAGRHTPDFLFIRRKTRRYKTQPDFAPDKKAGNIERVLIVETKGAGFDNKDFQGKRDFIETRFIDHNPRFRYKCFVVKSDDFTPHLTELRGEIQQWLSASEENRK